MNLPERCTAAPAPLFIGMVGMSTKKGSKGNRRVKPGTEKTLSKSMLYLASIISSFIFGGLNDAERET